MDWDVRYNGASIKSKVLSCNITKSLESFCREIDIELIDTTIYSEINWTRIPETPQIEVSIDDGAGWHTIGSFFIERPTYSVDPSSKGMRGIWGRSKTALLAEPFARTYTKTWVSQTDVWSICEEVMSGSGITFSRTKCSGYPNTNFVVFPLTYSCEKAYPIDILNELAELCGAVVCTSNEDDIFFQIVNYSPLTADFTFSDDKIADYAEEMEFPDFKNRVLISADESSGNCDITLTADTECLIIGNVDGVGLYARVSDDEGHGINNVPVAWTTAHAGVTLDSTSSNTEVMTLTEKVEANGFYSIQVTFPPSTVASIVKTNASYGQGNNLAEGGYTLDGTTIVLSNTLEYCDESLTVTYTTDGVARNKMRPGTTYGEDVVTASVGGIKANLDVYIGNPCKCSGTGAGDIGYGLTVIASPKNICPHTNGVPIGGCGCSTTIGCTTRILVAADEYGPVKDGRRVQWEEVSPGGKYLYFRNNFSNLAIITVDDIEATITEINSNYIVCQTEFYFSAVEGRWRISAVHPWVDLNYAWDIDGKTFKLPYVEEMGLGQKVYVNGPIFGASVITAEGIGVGAAIVRATVQGRREEPMVGEVTIGVGVTVGEEPGNDPDPQPDPDPEPDPEDPNDPPFNPHTRVFCVDASTNTREQCTAEQRCCQGKGDDTAIKCRAPGDCRDGELGCGTADCSAKPSSSCLNGRFATGRENGCDCEEMCKNEFDRLWTTQSYDNSSYKPISRILSERGYSASSPTYWEHFETERQSAIDKCLDDCDDCENATDVALFGPSAVTKPGGYAYSAGGGRRPYTYTVSGTGATIDAQTGYVTLSESACGSITVTVIDNCGNSDSITAKITNSGQWGPWSQPPQYHSVSPNGCECNVFWGHNEEVIAGAVKYYYCYTGCRCCKACECNSGPPSSDGGTIFDGSSLNNACWSFCCDPHVERNDSEADWYSAKTSTQHAEWIC